jgi:hypothetical protein
MTYEQIQDKLAAQEAAKLRAKAIVEVSADLEVVVKTEVGRVVVEEITKILDLLHKAARAIEAAPEKNPRVFIVKLLGKISNRLSVISAGYAAGSLPKVQK